MATMTSQIPTDLCSIADASAQTGISQLRIRNWLRTGRIRRFRQVGKVFISLGELRGFSAIVEVPAVGASIEAVPFAYADDDDVDFDTGASTQEEVK